MWMLNVEFLARKDVNKTNVGLMIQMSSFLLEK